MSARRPDSEEGAVAPLVALLLASLCGFAGLAVDMGLVQYERRALQASVDAAALSAARAPEQAQAIAATVLGRNGGVTGTPSVVAGTYTDDPALPAAARFSAGGAANAVRVTAQRSVPLGLTRVLGGPASAQVAATAVAEHRPLAGFAIGSTTAQLDAGILNAALGRLLGGNVNLDLASYQGLLGTNMGLFRFSDALASSLNLNAGDYQQLLNTRTSVSNLLGVAARVLADRGVSSASVDPATGTAATALDILSQAASGQLVRVGDLVNLAVHQARPIGSFETPLSYADLGLNAFDLLTAASSLGGANTATLPITLGLPGLAAVSTQVMVVEPMQVPGTGPAGLGPVGTRVETSQVRALLDASLLPTTLPGIPTPVTLRLPVLVEVAPAQAELREVTCQGEPGTDTEIRIQATTGVARAQVGQVDAAQLANPGPELGTLPAAPVLAVTLNILGINVGVTVSAQASASLGSGAAELSFTPADIAAGTERTVFSSGPVHTLIGSLGSSLVLTTSVDLSLVPTVLLASVNAALGPVLTALVGGARAALQPVLTALDTTVDQLLASLGVRGGIANVRATGVRCGVASLVL